MFSILRTVNKYGNCSTNVLIRLFNALSVPIALYNSEVWGSMLFSKNDINFETLLDDSIISNLQRFFCKSPLVSLRGLLDGQYLRKLVKIP